MKENEEEEENWWKPKKKPKTEEERKELEEMEENMKNPYFDACFYYNIQPEPKRKKWNEAEERPGPDFDVKKNLFVNKLNLNLN